MTRSIEDQELLLDENGFSDHRTNATSQEWGGRSDDMDEKADEIADGSILTRNGSAPGMPLNHQLAIDKRNTERNKRTKIHTGVKFLVD